ncbi:MAG: Hpt domain-containing protein [Pseudomonadota bacterium]
MHLNRQIITELKQLMEEEFPILIRTFIDDSYLRLDRLIMCVSQKNYEEIRREAHSFKGSSSNMGAVTLTELCLELEHLSAKTKLDHSEFNFIMLQNMMDKINSELKAVAEELQTHLE